MVVAVATGSLCPARSMWPPRGRCPTPRNCASLLRFAPPSRASSSGTPEKRVPRAIRRVERRRQGNSYCWRGGRRDGGVVISRAPRRRAGRRAPSPPPASTACRPAGRCPAPPGASRCRPARSSASTTSSPGGAAGSVGPRQDRPDAEPRTRATWSRPLARASPSAPAGRRAWPAPPSPRGRRRRRPSARTRPRRSVCGRPTTSPASIPSSVCTSSSAPATARRSSRSPVVSRGRIGSVSTPSTGPASSSSTIVNVVAPVMSSPARIAAWHRGRAAPGRAGPRSAGSPSRGAGRRAPTAGRSAPYATTGAQSGASSASRARNSSSRGRRGPEHLDPGLERALGDRTRDGMPPATGRRVRPGQHRDDLVVRRQQRLERRNGGVRGPGEEQAHQRDATGRGERPAAPPSRPCRAPRGCAPVRSRRGARPRPGRSSGRDRCRRCRRPHVHGRTAPSTSGISSAGMPTPGVGHLDDDLGAVAGRRVIVIVSPGRLNAIAFRTILCNARCRSSGRRARPLASDRATSTGPVRRRPPSPGDAVTSADDLGRARLAMSTGTGVERSALDVGQRRGLGERRGELVDLAPTVSSAARSVCGERRRARRRTGPCRPGRGPGRAAR